MGLLRLKVNGEYVTVAQGPAGPIGPQGPEGPEIAVLTTAERDALSGPNLYEGKVIYNSDLDVYQGYVGGSWGDFITSKGGTMTSRLNLLSYRETRQSEVTATSGQTVTIDPSLGTMQTVNASAGPITIAFHINWNQGDSMLLRIFMDTARAVTWPANIYWNGGAAPSLVVGHNLISLHNESGAWWGSYVGKFG